MSAITGSDKNQALVPIATTESAADPKVQMIRKRKRQKSTGLLHKRARKEISRKHEEEDEDDPPRDEDNLPLTKKTLDNLNKRHSPRPRKRSTQDERRYRTDSPVDSVESDLEILANRDKLKEKSDTPTPMDKLSDDVIPPVVEDDDDDDFHDQDDEYADNDDGLGLNIDEDDGYDMEEEEDDGKPQYTYNETLEKKAAILSDLDRRSKMGEHIEYDDKMTLEQLMLVKNKVLYRSRSTHMIRIMRQGITMYASFLEWATRRFPALNLDLTDFSKEMFTKKNDYDDLLYEVYDMYSDNMKMNPLVMLLLTITAQAAMYSVARNFVKNIQQNITVSIPPPPQTDGAQESELGNLDDQTGPIDGFATNDLLELCRQEAQAKIDTTSSTTIQNDTITVDIPVDETGITIVKKVDDKPTRKKRTKNIIENTDIDI
jgi:hypothetical protein